MVNTISSQDKTSSIRLHKMLIFNDQLNNSILLEKTPKRIVSLVPSITELLIDLGLEEKIIGITKFCSEPAYLRTTKKIIGGTKKLNINTIKECSPDIVFANKEENNLEDIKIIQTFCKVWTSDVKTIKDANKLIEQIGLIFNIESKAFELIKKSESVLKKLKSQKLESITVCYLIWKNPYMTVGKDTYIHDVLTQLGFINQIKEDRYPKINLNTILKNDFIFLSSEPYPFKEIDLIELNRLTGKENVFLVDGTYFSWYGSRFSKSIDYFINLFSSIKETTINN